MIQTSISAMNYLVVAIMIFEAKCDTKSLVSMSCYFPLSIKLAIKTTASVKKCQ